MSPPPRKPSGGHIPPEPVGAQPPRTPVGAHSPPIGVSAARLSLDWLVQDDLAATWDEDQLEPLVTAIVDRHFGTSGTYALTLHLVTDAHIRALNAAHRGVDAATDVLSFPLQDVERPGFVLPPEEPIHLGDVVVSYPRAMAQAVEFGHSTNRELAYLVAHGVLHVLGYDHEVDADRARMRQLEEEALQPLGFTR